MRLRSRCLCTRPTFDLPRVRQELLTHWTLTEARIPEAAGRAARYCQFTFQDAERLYQSSDARWHWLDREMSSNVAGETGAVEIYRGALAALSLRRAVGFQLERGAEDFAREHMEAEQRHLSVLELVVHDTKHTRLLPAWRVAGWTLGFLPTVLVGSQGLFVTVEAVETFVEAHYGEQIAFLEHADSCPELLRLLRHFCADEVHHKEDAHARLSSEEASSDGLILSKASKHAFANVWGRIVRIGSTVAADVARRF